MSNGWKQIKRGVLSKVVDDQSHVFATKDVSEDARMMQAHPDPISTHRNYHSFVGRFLSIHRDTLRIEEIRKRTSRGSLWKKLG